MIPKAEPSGKPPRTTACEGPRDGGIYCTIEQSRGRARDASEGKQRGWVDRGIGVIGSWGAMAVWTEAQKRGVVGGELGKINRG